MVTNLNALIGLIKTAVIASCLCHRGIAGGIWSEGWRGRGLALEAAIDSVEFSGRAEGAGASLSRRRRIGSCLAELAG